MAQSYNRVFMQMDEAQNESIYILDICIYMNMCMNIYVQIYVYIYIYVYVCLYMYVYVYTTLSYKPQPPHQSYDGADDKDIRSPPFLDHIPLLISGGV